MAAKVKDYLRATLVVKTMGEVVLVWAAVEALQAQGRLAIVGVKNRLRWVLDGGRGMLAGHANQVTYPHTTEQGQGD